MELKPFTRTDKDIYLEMSRDFYKIGVTAVQVPEDFWVRTFEAIINKSPYVEGFMLLHKNEVVGYALACLSWSNEAGGPLAWLEELYLKPETRGQGLGRAVFEAMVNEYSAKAVRLRLEVMPDNQKAISLYESLGFEYLPYKQMFINCEK